MLCLGGLLAVPQPASGTETAGALERVLNNGIHVRIYPADYLASIATYDGTRAEIPLGGGKYLTVITDISDPLIANKGDGDFHAFEVSDVIDLLGEINHPSMSLDVEVYLLPYPRSNMLMSSTSGTTVFLSPHVLEISRESAAYVIAHELGHVFQNRYLQDHAYRPWGEYRAIRGIDDRERFSDSASHAFQPKEIFAEDFRVMFGGASAFFGGRVENVELASPLHVDGLAPFFARLTTSSAFDADAFIVGVSNFPNPFNPSTRIVVDVSGEFVATGQPLAVRVYDVRGALVRELYSQQPTGPQIVVTWDGRDHAGRLVASATYFGVAEAGSHAVAQKLLMVK